MIRYDFVMEFSDTWSVSEFLKMLALYQKRRMKIRR